MKVRCLLCGCLCLCLLDGCGFARGQMPVCEPQAVTAVGEQTVIAAQGSVSAQPSTPSANISAETAAWPLQPHTGAEWRRYQHKTDAEYRRYRQQADKITQTFNRWIQNNRDIMQGCRRQGYVYRGDRDQYEYDVSALEGKISRLISRLQGTIGLYCADTSAQYGWQLAWAQARLQYLEGRLAKIRIGWSLACEIKALEQANAELEEQKRAELKKAWEKHKQNLRQIRRQYGYTQ